MTSNAVEEIVLLNDNAEKGSTQMSEKDHSLNSSSNKLGLESETENSHRNIIRY